MKKKITLALLFLTVFFLLSIFTISVILIFSFSFRENEERNNFSKMYLHQEIPFSEKMTSKPGFSRLKVKLLEDEYVTFKNEERGSYFIISNFGGEEYKCTGSCYCEDENHSRRNANIMSSGLFVILSAFSLTVAISMAKDTFRETCFDKFSDVCDKSNIRSDFFDCDLEDLPPHIHTVDELLEVYHPKGKDSWECYGHCKANDYHNPKDAPMNKKLENLEIIKKVKLACEKEEFRGNLYIDEGSSKDQAELKFSFLHLEHFCMESSMEFLKDSYGDDLDDKVFEEIYYNALEGYDSLGLEEMKDVADDFEKADYLRLFKCVGPRYDVSEVHCYLNDRLKLDDKFYE